MKLRKTMVLGSMLLVPTMAMGIAQQDPANPATTNPATPGQQQLQQDQAMATTGAEQEMVGVIEEVRDDSFSLRTDDRGLVWFAISPELEQSASSELVTGNRVKVAAEAGDSADRMNAIRVERHEGTEAAAGQMPERDSTVAETTPDSDTDTDLDADVNVDSDSATARLETETEYEDSDAQIAQTETQFRDDAQLREDTTEYDTDADRDELPRTASSLPALGSLGLLALLGAAAVAFARRF